MPFKKGDKRPKNAGRKKGSVNKAKKETKDALNEFIQNHQGDVKSWFDALDSPDKKLNYFIKLLEFTTPKMKSVEATHEVKDTGIKVIIEVPDDDNTPDKTK